MSDELSNPVMRFDFVEMSHKITTTPQGFLRIPARFTRTGIFTYINIDPVTGKQKESKEYRPPEEVFNQDSLNTIANSPLTDGHPNIDGVDTTVNPDNFKKLSVGWVGPELRQDGEYVAGTLTVGDKSMIEAIHNGLRKELSVGYQCRLDLTPGVINGERYDAIQRNIIGNHVALLPVGQGRAGANCALRLDSKDAVLSGIHTMGDEMEPEVKADKAHKPVEAVQAVEIKPDQTLELQAKIDALTEELARKDAALPPGDYSVVNTQTLQLAGLLHGAMRVLGDNYDFTGMRVDEVKMAVLSSLASGADLKGRSDDYISGYYDAVMAMKAQEAMDSSDSDSNIMDQLYLDSKSPEDAPKTDAAPVEKTMKGDSLAQANSLALAASLGKKSDSISAREDMLNRTMNAWKQDLAFTKSKVLSSQS